MKSDSLVIQKMTVSDDKFAYQAGALALTPEGPLIVVGPSRPAGITPDGTETALLWRVNLAGEQLQEIALTLQPEQPPLQIDYVYSALILENGDVFLLALVRDSSSVEHTSLVRINKTGHVLFVSAVKLAIRPRSDVLLFRMVRVDERHFFLFGSTAKGVLLVKVDEQGNTVREKTFDHEQKEDVLLDGFVTPKGGAVLVGESNNKKTEGSEPSTVWVMRVDATGEVQAKKTLPGRRARVAPTADGGVVMTYDSGQQNTQEAWMQALDAELKPQWKTHLFSSDFGFTPLYVTLTTEGGYIVATTQRGLHLWIAKVDLAGKKTGEYFEEHQPKRLIDNSLLAVKDTFYLLIEGPYSNVKSQISSKIEVVKFIVK